MEKYGHDYSSIERIQKMGNTLKCLYRTSQVEGDLLPAWLPDDLVESILDVHLICPLGEGGEAARKNMIVLTPTLHALLHACSDATVDLKNGTLCIPSLNIERKINVKQDHNG